MLFLYGKVLGTELPWLADVVRAVRPPRPPVVLSRDEVRALFAHMRGTPRLMAVLLFGTGMRVLECARLRIKDLDFTAHQVVVRSGKGHEDRVTLLPSALESVLHHHLARVRAIHQADLRAGAGWVELPGALGRKYPNAGKTATRSVRSRSSSATATSAPP